MMHAEAVAGCCKNNMKHLKRKCKKNAEILNFKACFTVHYSNHCTLSCYYLGHNIFSDEGSRS